MQESPQVQAIRARYVASFPEKAEMIDGCIAMVSRKSVAEADLQEVKEQLHKLAGSSGMYGYQDICNIARSGMLAIDSGDCGSLLDGLKKLRELLLEHS